MSEREGRLPFQELMQSDRRGGIRLYSIIQTVLHVVGEFDHIGTQVRSNALSKLSEPRASAQGRLVSIDDRMWHWQLGWRERSL